MKRMLQFDLEEAGSWWPRRIEGIPDVFKIAFCKLIFTYTRLTL